MCCLCAVLCEVYGLQAACAAPVLSVSKSLCCTWTCLYTRAFVLVLHLGFSYKSFVLHQDVSAYKSFALHLDVSLSTRACVAPVRICLQDKNFVMHLDVSAYKSPAHAVPVGVRLKKIRVCFGLFRNRYVCFGCFDDTFSKLRNKLNQTRKFIFLVTWTKPKNNRNRLSTIPNQTLIDTICRPAWIHIPFAEGL